MARRIGALPSSRLAGGTARHISQPMPKMRAKADLPSKPCRHCGRPMAWRKAWARNWDEVLYCSDRCRMDAARARRNQSAEPSTTIAEPSARNTV